MKWVFMATLAALPLQWFVITSTPLGVGRLHQLAILGFAAIFVMRYRIRATAPLQRTLGYFVIANIVMLTMWSIIMLYHSQIPTGPIKEFLYLGVFLTVGAFVYRAGSGRETKALELMRWSAAVAALSVLLALSYSMLLNGVSPPKIFAQTIATGDPEIFQKEMFKNAFVGFGYDEATVRGNIRHEVFGAVLCSMYIAAWAAKCRPLRGRLQHSLYQLSMLLGAVLLIASLSRSIIIAAALWPAISLFRSVRAFELRTRQVAMTLVFMVIAGVAVVSGAAAVLWTRFTADTSSYEARQGLYDQAFSQLPGHFFTGGVDTQGESSHNFVIDALLRGGIFVGLPAAVVMLSIVFTFIALMMRLHLEPIYMVPVAAAFVLPIVRFGTSGGGLINPVEWITLGFVAGAMATNHVRKSRTERPATRSESNALEPVRG